jgi:hypothetical protein
MYWTAPGILRQARVVAGAREAFQRFLAERTEHKSGSNSGTDEQAVIDGQLNVQRDLLKKSWDDAETLLTRLRPVPNGVSTETGCTGLVATVRHQTVEMIRKRGELEVFALGGVGENDTENKLHTFSIASPIGKALKGQEADSIVRVYTPDEGHYDVEIVSFETLTSFLERMPASMTGIESGAQLDLGLSSQPA